MTRISVRSAIRFQVVNDLMTESLVTVRSHGEKKNMSKASRVREMLDELNHLVDEIELDEESEVARRFIELGDLPYRVIHLENNPLTKCVKGERQEYEELRKDNDRLKARLSLIETGNNVDVTMRIEEAVNNAQQIERLKREVAEYKSREEKISSSLRKTASDFRQACLSLIGYRVDALKNNIYRLTHQHAANEDDKLFFEVKRDGTIVLLKNEFSQRYSQFVSTYVDRGDSLPAFLAAINLEMFKAQRMNSTQSVDMSMSMSTTILPNPNFSRLR